ncbi:MAG: hypothetical protein AB7P03_17170 [Kofleriaceae bacterium]
MLGVLGVGACGGDGGTDLSARCSLEGKAYDAFYGADGPSCGGEGFGDCLAGDSCREDGVCEIVGSAPADKVSCAALAMTYDSFYGPDGPGCGGEGFGDCFPGDHCASDGVCEIVLSAKNGSPHPQLIGSHYDSFSGAGGPGCGGEGFGGCLPGDHCVENGVCEAVLSAFGGIVDESKIGDHYDSFSGAGGPGCGGEGFGSCYPGDRCVEDGTCEIVLSARTES